MSIQNYAKVPAIYANENSYNGKFKPIDSGNMMSWRLVETLPSNYGDKKPDGDATITSNMPTKPYQVAIKKYCDDTFVKMDKSLGLGADTVYVRDDGTGQTQNRFIRTNGTPGVNWKGECAGYTERGTVIASDPVEIQDLVTLKYFNNNVPTIFNTVFGNSVKGIGNIDLYQHSVTITLKNTGNNNEVAEADLLIYSSKNLPIDSLEDLKTILGNSFKVPATGVFSNVYTVVSVTATGVNTIQTNGIVLLPFASYTTTFTDVVTTI